MTTDWISLDEKTPEQAGALEVRIRLTDGSELNCWAQSDGDFWWKVKDCFISEFSVTHWKPQPPEGD